MNKLTVLNFRRNRNAQSYSEIVLAVTLDYGAVNWVDVTIWCKRQGFVILDIYAYGLKLQRSGAVKLSSLLLEVITRSSLIKFLL